MVLTLAMCPIVERIALYVRLFVFRLLERKGFALSFSLAANYGTGTSPRSLAVGDFNGG